MIGKLLGHYQITEKLGEGGMGVVYKARDTHLDRFVAIKVLPPERVADPERKRRFVQEAKAASALNHPNIIHVYDIDQADGTDYITMEHVEGKTLDQLISRKGMRLSEALKCSVQIADALAAAHEAGIIHRDLKPANVMVTDKGLVKVLDFGLAKLTEADESSESRTTETLEARTEEGTIVGTAAYMSPEQAEGKKVDARSDIFSLGSVLYEMVTGQKAFQGTSKMSTLSAILHQEPKPVSGITPTIPADLEKLINRCLRKDPAKRWQTIADVKVALDELKEDSDSGKLQIPGGAVTRRWPWLALAGAFLALVMAGVFVWWATRTPAAPPAPTLTRLTSDSGLTTDPALSSDGRLLAYASDRSGDGNLDIYVRQVAGGDPLRLTHDPADDFAPAFSPDGTSVVFRSNRGEGGVYVVSALGGPARRIALDGDRPQFSPDGNWIAYSVGWNLAKRGHCKIYLASSGGGAPREVQAGFFAALYPTWAPDGKHLLFVGVRDLKGSLEDDADWWITSTDSETAVRTGALEVIRKANLSGRIHVWPGVLLTPAWHPAGDSLIFSARSGDSANLWRMGISPKTWKVTRPPQLLTSGPTLEESPSVATEPGGAVRVAFASLSENTDLWSLPIDANQGRVTGDPKRLTENAATDFHPGLSKDGVRVAFISDRSGRQEIWIKDLLSGEESALTASRSDKWLPRFSPDGSKVSFSSYENKKWNIYLVPRTGGASDMICEDCGQATGWSPDGKRIIGNALPWRVWLVDPISHRSTDLRLRLVSGIFSPDARWITLTDLQKTFVAPFRGEASLEESVLITVAEGALVDWSPDGTWLYGQSGRDGNVCLWAQRVDPASKHAAGPAVPIFHSHSKRRSITSQNWSRMGDVVRDKIVFGLVERTGNIWMAEFKP